MELTFTLSQALFSELEEACKESRCSPRQFAGECVEAILASRRLPKVPPAAYGGRHGPRIVTPEVESDAELEGYPVRLEQMT